MVEKVLMKGNEALAEAAIRAGCRNFFGYPITPQTEVSAYMAKAMPRLGGTFLQAESEVAAIHMVYGAASAGVRCMTSSSSPGISLKAEGISYLAASDLPCVLINIQRGSPGLGGIQPSQEDYNQATKAPGHGDFHIMVLAPSCVQEMVDLTMAAFDLADEYRMPVMILADGLLGQMMEPVALGAYTPKELPPKDWALTGHNGARERNVVNSLYLTASVLEQLVIERYQRYERIAQQEQRWEGYCLEDAKLVVVAFGASARLVRTAVSHARERGIQVGLLRPISLWPFPCDGVRALLPTAEQFLSVEMNMGQMVDDVRLAVNGAVPVHFYGRTGGMVPTPLDIEREIMQLTEGGEATWL